MNPLSNKAFFISVPHAGETVPDSVPWLKGLPETILMQDVDRYVDQLYLPAIEALKLKNIITEWHRYVVDLNRLPDDIDKDSVAGAKNDSGSFTTGLHWSKTTRGEVLMPKPMSLELHKDLLKNYFEPFHQQIIACFDSFRKQGHNEIYHLDAHSMPSMGTAAHRDPGKLRPEIVVSDQDGTSCASEFKDLVIAAYKEVGFEVAYNWPYKGGRVTQAYGQPSKGQHTLQVELRRSLYMNEETKKKNDLFDSTQEKIKQAITIIYSNLNL